MAATPVIRPYFAKACVPDMLQELHDSSSGGHFGISKSERDIRIDELPNL